MVWKVATECQIKFESKNAGPSSGGSVDMIKQGLAYYGQKIKSSLLPSLVLFYN